MNTNNTTRVPTRFAAPAAFPVDVNEPKPVAPDYKEQLADLQERLVAEAVETTPVLKIQKLAPLIGDEAAGLAVNSGFPLLTFPTLFGELLARVRLQQKRQQEVQLRSELMLEEVA